MVKRISGVISEDGKTIIPTGFKIRKVGTEEIYDEAIDVEGSPYEYEETNELVEYDESIELEEKALAYDIMVGEVK